MFLTAARSSCWSYLDHWNKFQLVLINRIPLIYLLVSKHKTLYLYRRHSNQYIAAVTITDLLLMQTSLKPKQLCPKCHFRERYYDTIKKGYLKLTVTVNQPKASGLSHQCSTMHWDTTTKKLPALTLLYIYMLIGCWVCDWSIQYHLFSTYL